MGLREAAVLNVACALLPAGLLAAWRNARRERLELEAREGTSDGSLADPDPVALLDAVRRAWAGVRYDPTRDAAWWEAWWTENRLRFAR